MRRRVHAQEPDFGEWSDRLEIFGVDLRNLPSVEAFCRDMVATREQLDFIINNACQTVRRPPEFYTHMMAEEMNAAHQLPAHVRRLLGDPQSTPAVRANAGSNSALMSQVRLLDEELSVRASLFPEGRLDENQQQIDLRDMNSWRMLLADVPTVEMIEVQLVNAIAPFLFNARLKPLMLRTPDRDKHIVNVSAVGRAVLPHRQDDQASAYEHGQGGAEHDDAHRRDGLLQRRHPHEQRRHWVGDRRGSNRDRDAQDCRAAFPSTARHRRRRAPASSRRSSRGSTPAHTCGASS